ncbi:hypothetical protein ACLMJV_31750 [Sinorhizobium meliloti]|uniref:hypothetical protein n=1 Tax=Rhizobium meliloti TaxID=382 RepID=UPI00398D2305
MLFFNVVASKAVWELVAAKGYLPKFTRNLHAYCASEYTIAATENRTMSPVLGQGDEGQKSVWRRTMRPSASDFNSIYYGYDAYGEPAAGTVTSYAAFYGSQRLFYIEDGSVAASKIVAGGQDLQHRR